MAIKAKTATSRADPRGLAYEEMRALNADLLSRLKERLSECDHAAEPCLRCDADRAAIAKAEGSR